MTSKEIQRVLRTIRLERYVNELLKKQGYKTEMTPARNDYGVGIVAERDGARYAVQCKRYGENISRGAVSDAVAGKHYYKCGQVIERGGCTQ